MIEFVSIAMTAYVAIAYLSLLMDQYFYSIDKTVTFVKLSIALFSVWGNHKIYKDIQYEQREKSLDISVALVINFFKHKVLFRVQKNKEV